MNRWRCGLVFIANVLLVAPAAAQHVARRSGTTDDLPLEPARTISFTTDEGTWISLDVSPDGRTIVFDLLGDLYTLPVTGGRAKRITGGMAFDGQPRYSPDGKHIVFVSDRSGGDNVWLVDTDGRNARAITASTQNQYVSPVWTPDGQAIIVSQAPTPFAYFYELYQYPIDGGGGERLNVSANGAPGGQPNNFLGATFGPDPRYVYVSTKQGGPDRYHVRFGWSVSRIDRQTGRLEMVAAPMVGGAMRPMLTPDGRYLVYATRQDTTTGVRLRDLVTGDEDWLVRHAQRDDQEARGTRDLMPGSAFLPDGSALIHFNRGKLWRVDIPSGRETLIPFTAGVELQLGPLVKFDYPIDNDSTFVVRQIRDTQVSPDGRRIVFIALDRLWIADLPAGGSSWSVIGDARRLTQSDIGEFEPSWSPDGDHIVYVTWSDSGGHIVRVRADGTSQPERLTSTPALYRSPVYSPSGAQIVAVRADRAAYTQDSRRSRDLIWIPADGGATTAIATFPRYPGAPYFVGGDGSRIHIGGESMRFDGTDQRTHLSVSGPSFGSGQNPIISPDGDQALVQAGGQVYLVPMLAAADTPVAVRFPSDAPPGAVRVSEIGGEFMGWAPGGSAFHYSLGPTLFIHDLRPSSSAPQAASAPRRIDIRITAVKDRPSGTVVLRGARIITMNGYEIIEDGDVVVVGNRIAAIASRGTALIPSGARVVDVSGKTIIPGFVDIHWHHNGHDNDIHQPELWNYQATLAWGTTTFRDPQSGTSDVLTYADMVEAGEMLGPRVFTTGPGLNSERFGVASLDDTRNLLKRFSEFYRTGTLKQYSMGERRARQWIAIAAREQGLTPTNEGFLDFRKSITQILDGYAGDEHSYPVYPLYKDFIELHSQSGLTVTPVLLGNKGGPPAQEYFFASSDFANDPKVQRFVPQDRIAVFSLRRPAWFREDQYVFRQEAAQLNKILQAGGRVGFGTHGYFHGIGAHWELWLLQSGGMKNHDALRVATILSADAIGLAGDIGSLEAGKLADLQVLDENPLDDIRHSLSLHYVMKNGRLYDADTLDEVWPRQLKRPLPPGWSTPEN